LASVRDIRAYLYKSVRHQAIDYLRKEPAATDNVNVYELEVESAEPLADELMEREQFRELLQKAFDSLPERCRMIARMHFNDQLQYKEIAAILDISRKTVETQISIAFRKVNDIFTSCKFL
jgi:RNA polymerase sigma-70 factor (ECF subfamily)